MKRRPLPVTIISCIYLAAGVLGLAFHAGDFKTGNPLQFDVIGVALVRLAAIVAGAFMLRGNNWARWLAVAWMAFHVVVGAFHSATQLLVHLVMLAIFAYLLFRPAANAYFRQSA